MACAKFCSDHIIIRSMKISYIFQLIWNVREKSWVTWPHVSLGVAAVAFPVSPMTESDTCDYLFHHIHWEYTHRISQVSFHSINLHIFIAFIIPICVYVYYYFRGMLSLHQKYLFLCNLLIQIYFVFYQINESDTVGIDISWFYHLASCYIWRSCPAPEF